MSLSAHTTQASRRWKNFKLFWRTRMQGSPMVRQENKSKKRSNFSKKENKKTLSPKTQWPSSSARSKNCWSSDRQLKLHRLTLRWLTSHLLLSNSQDKSTACKVPILSWWLHSTNCLRPLSSKSQHQSCRIHSSPSTSFNSNRSSQSWKTWASRIWSRFLWIS